MGWNISTPGHQAGSIRFSMKSTVTDSLWYLRTFMNWKDIIIWDTGRILRPNLRKIENKYQVKCSEKKKNDMDSAQNFKKFYV